MANFKRLKPRHQPIKAQRGSTASWRARFGLKPVRLLPSKNYTTAEWRAAWRVAPNENHGLKICGGHPSMMSSYPAWWDRTFHTRPARAKNRVTLRRILIGTADPDDVFWRDGRKPHIYYY